MQVDNIRPFPRPAIVEWRPLQRRCILRAGERNFDVVLLSVSAAGAFVEVDDTIDLDTAVVLMHPEAGQIPARIARVGREGAALSFAVGPQATTFALAALCAGMTVTAANRS